MWIMDFGTDDNFNTSWQSNPMVKAPWYQVTFEKEKAFNTVVITEARSNISRYRLEYWQHGGWKLLFEGENKGRVKIHRFDRKWGGKVRISVESSDTAPAIAEFGVYDERR